MVDEQIKNNNDSHSEQVRDRLLDAGERLFAENGFEGTSIRQITADARCNVAAVNYHFGGKEKLYDQVFRRRLLSLRQQRINSIQRVLSGTDTQDKLELLLRAYAEAFLEPLVSDSTGRRFIKLMMNEMKSPKILNNIFVNEMVIPVTQALHQALGQICPNLNDPTLMMCVHSLHGQLIHVIRVREFFGSETEAGTESMQDLKTAVDHIVAFTAAAIRALEKDD